MIKLNKHETYEFNKQYFNAILSRAEDLIKQYQHEKSKPKKFKLMLELLTSLKKMLEDKQREEKKCNKPNYSEEDVDFLRGFSAFELTKHEAYLTGKQDEYYEYLRMLSDTYSRFEPSIQSKVDEELKKIDDNNITPRLVMECFGKFSTKRKK